MPKMQQQIIEEIEKN